MRSRTTRRLLLTLVPALALGLSGAPTAAASAEPRSERWKVVDNDQRTVRLAGKGSVSTGVRAARTSVTGPVTAPFVVNYSPATGAGAWTATQKAAFQRAIDVWARLLVSPVPIEVDAVLEPLPAGFLGSAGPKTLVQDTLDGTWYPIALGNTLESSDLNGGAAEIEASFPSNNPDIYYGTGTPPVGTYDFTSTAMHEIGHGLGFLGSMDHDGTRGTYGVDPPEENPLAFDRYAVHVPSTTAFPLLSFANDSPELGAALESQKLFWDGGAGKAAAGGQRPKLFAPTTWESGSSYSHLDEASYAPGTLNSLMTPVGDQREVNAEPGPIALGMLEDTGWSLSAAADPPLATKFTPIEPVRVLDTRPGAQNIGAPAARVGAGGVLDLKVAGTTTVPADATAVVLNVTGIGPTKNTDIRVYPLRESAAAVPLVSSINLAEMRTRANLVTVKVGLDGKVRLRNNDGTIDLAADLAGYYTTGGSSTYFPVTPSRVLDTRNGIGRGGAAGPVPADSFVDLQVAGVGGVPLSATAVVLGVTAVNASQSTDVRVYPTPTNSAALPPTVSNINVYKTVATPNLVIVQVGASGQVRLRNSAGIVSLLADVFGYYDASGAGALFRALDPDRVLDTRDTAVPRVSGPGFIDLVTAGAGGVGAGATAVVLNVTGTGATAPTDIRLYPTPSSAGPVPTVSSLNLVKGQTAADAAIVPIGAGTKVRLYNNNGAVALIADVAGWFGPA